MCHVVIGKDEATLVLPGLLGSKGDTELAPKPLVVEADGGERLDGGVHPYQLSSHRDEKIEAPKAHVCAWDPADAMVSHPWPDVERAKTPYLARQLLMFQINTN